MPFLDLFVARGRLVMAGVEKIFEHPEQVEIHEARALAKQKRLVQQHLLERNQFVFKLFEQFALLLTPSIKAAAAKLAFFVSLKSKLLRLRHQFLPINIIQPESNCLNFIFDESPKNGLDAAQFRRKQIELKFFVQVFGNDLRIIVDFKYNRFAVTNDRHAIITLFGQFPDQRAVLIQDVCDFEGRTGKFQNAALNEAERTPRKLDQFNHVKI